MNRWAGSVCNPSGSMELAPEMRPLDTGRSRTEANIHPATRKSPQATVFLNQKNLSILKDHPPAVQLWGLIATLTAEQILDLLQRKLTLISQHLSGNVPDAADGILLVKK